MTKTNIKIRLKQALYGLIAVVLTLAYFPSIASASAIAPRKVTIGSSVASASTTYSFVFTVPQATVIKSASFTACTTASGSCTPAPGFSASSSTLTAQPTNLGDAAGWTVDTGTANSLRLKKTGNVAAPTGSQTVGFSAVTNPNATNSTFFMRIATFSDDAWTTGIDSGVAAASTAGQITVTAAVDETLTFTLATATVALGTLTTSSTGTGTSSMTVGTNGATGYSVAYNGNTLTSGTNTITGMTVLAGSTQNSKQFGINLVANTTPTIGSNKSGGGTGVPTAGVYDTTNQFKFNPAGEVVAAATVPTNTNTFTTSYIANIDAVTAAGAYSTVLTYTATANF
ncbi:MAG: hypothetical protein NTV39_00825 [Candidatus Saccharibacteria bacterium]|nr:hypothetical protein [Candidatus Saccharibacteria bacterium]